MQTEVAIVGAGPAGMLLAHLLGRAGVESIVVERRRRAHVAGRIRAGVLEWGTVQILTEAGLGDRLHAEGHVHDRIDLAWQPTGPPGRTHAPVIGVDIEALTGRRLMAYGQTLIQEDLFAASDRAGTPVCFEAEGVALHGITTDHPAVTFRHGGVDERIDCRLVAGCDGSHGISRSMIPAARRTEYETTYPFGWLGILSETPPLPTITYARHERGFALCSMRNEALSRYYVQCPIDDGVADWSDDRFWTELTGRLPPELAREVVTGPAIERSLTPLRSFVCEPLRWGRLLLAGDVAHLVPPTGAKGLNLALADAFHLARAIRADLDGDGDALDRYGRTALARVWRAVRFSWWMTTLLHRFPDQSPFDRRIQDQELALLATSSAARTLLAEQYVGTTSEELP